MKMAPREHNMFLPKMTLPFGAATLVVAVLLLLCSSTTPLMAQPAPAISSFQISHVRSEQSGGNWEAVSQSALVTSGDHGGSYIEVAVRCMGYPNSHGATIATMNMSPQRTEYILDAQRRVVGFYLIYRTTRRMTDGNVSVWGTSINTGRRFTDSIRIR